MSESIIEILKNYFKTKPVLKAYIFGSMADNTATDMSDIDILVDLDYNGGASFDSFYNMGIDLNALLSRKVDLVSSNGLSKFIAPYINAQKKLIYEKGD